MDWRAGLEYWTGALDWSTGALEYWTSQHVECIPVQFLAFLAHFKHCEVNQLEIRGQINGEGGGSNAKLKGVLLQFTE